MKKTGKKKPGGAGKLPPWMPEAAAGRGDKPAKPGGGRRKQAPAAYRDPHAQREAQRYEKPIISREALLVHLAEQTGPQTIDELAKSLNLGAPEAFEALRRRIRVHGSGTASSAWA